MLLENYYIVIQYFSDEDSGQNSKHLLYIYCEIRTNMTPL